MSAIARNKFLRFSSDGSLRGQSSLPYSSTILKSILVEGEVIYKRVGKVVNKPKVEKRPVPFVVGHAYTADNDVDYTLLGYLGDKAVWVTPLHSSGAYLTAKDGTGLTDTYTSIPQPTEEVVVGNELVIEEE